jgi:hypothetical protein
VLLPLVVFPLTTLVPGLEPSNDAPPLELSPVPFWVTNVYAKLRLALAPLAEMPVVLLTAWHSLTTRLAAAPAVSAMKPVPLWKAAERTTLAIEPAPASTPAFPFVEKSQSWM